MRKIIIKISRISKTIFFFRFSSRPAKTLILKYLYLGSSLCTKLLYLQSIIYDTEKTVLNDVLGVSLDQLNRAISVPKLEKLHGTEIGFALSIICYN